MTGFSSKARVVLRPVKRAVASRRLGLARRGERRAVLIVSGPGGFGRLYRGDHRVAQLRAAGVAADVCYRTDVRLVPLAERYRCIVLYRVEWDDEVAALVAGAASAHCRVICDFDDLVFDPARIDLLRGISAMNAEARTAFIDSVARQRQTLESCGAATVATKPLAAEAAQVAANVAVVANCVTAEMIARSDAARAAARPRRRIRIGYLSGTPTHQADFEETAGALVRLLDRRADVEFVGVGFLELDERFAGRRALREPYRHPHELPALLATLDVNLAPLERGNAFTDCKTCIKYLEAGLVGVPTIASPRPDFARAMRNGENGLLADSPQEWEEALSRLVEDADLRRALGGVAREDVLTRHTARATAESALQSLEGLLTDLRGD